MVNKKVMAELLRKNGELLSDCDEEFSFVTDIQKAIDKLGAVKSDDYKLDNFDMFAFAWDRQEQADKLRLLYSAYRRDKQVWLGMSKIVNVMWSDLNESQHASLMYAADEMLCASVALFANRFAARSFLDCRVAVMRKKEVKEEKEMLKAVSSG